MSKTCYVSIDNIIKKLSVSALADLCGISRQYCYQLLRQYTKVQVFKMYCKLD